MGQDQDKGTWVLVPRILPQDVFEVNRILGANAPACGVLWCLCAVRKHLASHSIFSGVLVTCLGAFSDHPLAAHCVKSLYFSPERSCRGPDFEVNCNYRQSSSVAMETAGGPFFYSCCFNRKGLVRGK
jgi:hypothetical protein